MTRIVRSFAAPCDTSWHISPSYSLFAHVFYFILVMDFDMIHISQTNKGPSQIELTDGSERSVLR
jgi:hypothetical protein